MRWNTVDWISWVLLFVGGINWGLVGFFNYNLVDSVFGITALSRFIYAVVGIAALWQLVTALSKTGSRQ